MPDLLRDEIRDFLISRRAARAHGLAALVPADLGADFGLPTA